VMDADGTNQRRLASEIVAKSTRGWSPDGSRLVYAAGARNRAAIHVVDVASGRGTRLTASPGEDRDPSWSPDGARLAYSSTRDGSSQIYMMGADGGNVRRLTSGPAAHASPRWSPDGKAIALVCSRDRSQDLCLIDANGGRLERLTTGVRVTRDAPRWSPDGSRIAFQVADGDNYQIGVVRPADRRYSLLASSQAYDGSYDWAPDGSRLAFISGRDGFDGLFTVDADGRHSVRLTTTPSLTPAWGSRQ